MWNLEAPKRIRMFMWLVLNDAFLTNHVRMRRGMTVFYTCAVCNHHSETVLHTLKDCDLAKSLWMSINNSLVHDNFFHLLILQWVEENIMNKTQTVCGVSLSLLFATVCSSL